VDIRAAYAKETLRHIGGEKKRGDHDEALYHHLLACYMGVDRSGLGPSC